MSFIFIIKYLAVIDGEDFHYLLDLNSSMNFIQFYMVQIDDASTALAE